jgi:hypothetical protein
MEIFFGTIIEESLEDRSVLGSVKIISTKVEPITDKHQTPWVKQWTLHKVEVEANEAENIAGQISKSLDKNHKHSWYADYKNENIHYIIFRDKVFKINRTKIEEYNEATKYGLALGIPDYQVDFAKNVKI